MLSEDPLDELHAVWQLRCHEWGFAYSDTYSEEAFERGYALAMRWEV